VRAQREVDKTESQNNDLWNRFVELNENSKTCGSTKCAKEKVDLRRKWRCEESSVETLDALLNQAYKEKCKLEEKYADLKVRMQALETKERVLAL
jgi:uncharacterized protein YecT (DUF1311 family)